MEALDSDIGELAVDETAADVRASLAALKRGDLEVLAKAHDLGPIDLTD